MNKNKIKQWFALIFFTCLNSVVNAQSTGDLCVRQGVVAGFYNGVWNTTSDAGVGMNALASAIGVKTPAGEDIRWEIFYNTTTTKWADLVETFNQRASAQNVVVGERWELFWEAISGNGPTAGWTGVIGVTHVLREGQNRIAGDQMPFARSSHPRFAWGPEQDCVG